MAGYISYSDVVKAKFDAGLYRQYIARHFGGTLEFGGINGTYSTAVKHCRVLARITGLKLTTVIANAIEDKHDI